MCSSASCALSMETWPANMAACQGNEEDHPSLGGQECLDLLIRKKLTETVCYTHQYVKAESIDVWNHPGNNMKTLKLLTHP